jgi:hypothetical protein
VFSSRKVQRFKGSRVQGSEVKRFKVQRFKAQGSGFKDPGSAFKV